MKPETYQYAVGEVVNVDGVQCEILHREYWDGEADYCCRPLDDTKSIQGESPGGSAWVRLEELES